MKQITLIFSVIIFISALVESRAQSCENSENLPPVRAITHGPKYHWFGYYDKLEFDPSGRYVLGMVDLQDSDHRIELGESRAWCWQQGCMLQWRPGADTEVLWNDFQHGRYVCHILNVKTNIRRTIPFPVYTVSPDGRCVVIDSPHEGNGRQLYPSSTLAGFILKSTVNKFAMMDAKSE